jgi:dihydropyrimidinase
MRLLIKNGTCVNSDSVFNADLAVNDGKIIQIGNNLAFEPDQTIDAAGRYVLPGVIDTHVHLPWPSSNFDSVDDFRSGTLAAVHGGVTTIIEYVIPDESGRLLPALEQEVAKAKGSAFVDHSFHLIIRKVTEQTLQDMAAAMGRGFTSFKIYTAYAGFQLENEDILTLLRTAAEVQALVCFHAEDGNLVNSAIRELSEAGQTSICYYPQAHPRIADIEATQRVIADADQFNARIHIAHINTREGAQAVESARRSGQRVSGETCPHYLMFTEDVYKTGKPEAAEYILAPAIRAQADQDYLWQSIQSGGISTIATDHCPYNSEQKLKGGDDFRAVPGGAGGIETSLSIMFTYGVDKKRITISQLVSLMSTNPAKLFNLYPRKGVIAEGSDADLVIYNPEGRSVIDAAKLHGASNHSLYQGLDINGKVDTTILRGNIVINEGALLVKTPLGELLTRPSYSD